MRTSTDKIELVETGNIALSIRRLRKVPGDWNDNAAKRALYHAICMVEAFGSEERSGIRQVLKLP